MRNPHWPQVALSGESNNIKYTVEPQFIDLGLQQYDKHAEVDLVISNQGKVPFSYAINTRLLTRPSIIVVGARVVGVWQDLQCSKQCGNR